MLEVHDLSLSYGKREILSKLTIEPLQPGQLVALLGPNGSGKSTLLKSLAGLLKPTTGEILLDGQELSGVSFEQRAQKVVYLPQSLPASVHLRVFESVLVAANASAPGGHARDVDHEHIMHILQRLGIAHLSMHYLDQLSGGQKQLVGLAQALIRKPTLLLLDEPLSALDLNYQFHVMDLLAQETHDNNLITLIVLHDLNVALRHSDYALMIEGGGLLAQGEPAKVITPNSLAQAYGVRARVESCSQGTLQIIIDGLQEPVL
ncbi:ABC transporter ATP-binding protein [Alcaligenes nematophilus]|jgi:iron complex transport system ATP-binding protein|uniref:ABC transporter ATP-binding protein n=1 Tax=Alcaligenes faecalis TaxID=511 RepID=A0AAE9H6H0_ALCFA|nr:MULTISPECIES: ABC transporter ATP-binding protein [Alcaligenes]MDH4866719.1 ABC transporter ATP-binding protein [Bacillus cereus]ASC90314.1 ABC transporter ATP-binding protein [Alcaligenes faecalis]ERI33392.1 iron ABC transporter ATP-binding protein [Alcaligenes sp. EGD-AK7]KGP03546.1 iron ABC transporter ATP-binding protein [Alcaligenes faecalis]KVX07038.1 iron ABC transporter ATP-binding protein [Alcaligenes faecalis]